MNLDSNMALASDLGFTVETPSQEPHQAFAWLPFLISVTYPCLSFSFFIYWLVNHFSCYSYVSVKKKTMQGDLCPRWVQLEVKEGTWASNDGHQQRATATLGLWMWGAHRTDLCWNWDHHTISGIGVERGKTKSCASQGHRHTCSVDLQLRASFVYH